MKDKRKGKLEQHFKILCNGRQAKILNYKVREDADGGRMLEIVTKIPNQVWSSHNVLVQLEDGTRIAGTWYGQYGMGSVGLKRYYYRIVE